MFLNGKIPKPPITKRLIYSYRFKKYFATRGELIHYWGPRVNIYDQKELNAYLELCLEQYRLEKNKEEIYEDSY